MNKQLLMSVCALGFSLGLASCAGKAVAPEAGTAKKETVPLVGTYAVNRFVLDNGLKLLVVENHSSPTFSYQTWFSVGSRNEIPKYTGLAHLFEHMMFKGTSAHKEGEFDRILESAGAEGENAFTSRDYTAYVQEMPTTQLELITKMESDRMVNLIVDQKAFKTETEVVQNERRFRNENSPDGLMYQEIFSIAFTAHPYRWPVIGYQEDLERMSAADAVKFYKSYYSPNHATIAVAGDVDPQQVLALVKKYYGSLPAQPTPPVLSQAEPAQTAPRRKTLKLSMQVEKLMMGYHIPEVSHADTPALSLLSGVLTGGKSSRLHRALVETGIASSVDGYDLDDKDPSLLLIASNLQKGKKAAQAESVILRELARISSTGVTPAELERARNGLNFRFYEGFDSNSEITSFLGKYSVLGGNFELGLRIQERIQQVTPAEIMAVARKYLQPGNRSVIIGVPK
jgi:predicted Zn-dependent peptidase